MILNKYYGCDIEVGMPLIYKIPDEKTGLPRFFKTMLEHTFVNVKKHGKLPKLTEADIEHLMANMDDLDLWLSKLPPEKFEFSGFAGILLHDVTETNVLSNLKHRLLNRDSLINPNYFEELKDDLRAFLGIPDLQVGLAAFHEQESAARSYSRQLWNSFFMGESDEHFCPHFLGKMMDKLKNQKQPLIVADLETKLDDSPQLKRVKAMGIRNAMIAPLFVEDQLTGLLELGTSEVGMLNELTTFKVNDITPLFAAAISRSMDELGNQIEAIIKEKCTSIHPSVEWKFQDAAFNLLKKREAGETSAEMEQIVFKDVFPFYGQADIRGSSDERNKAATQDLIENLQLADQTIKKAQESFNFPLMEQVSFRIHSIVEKLGDGLHSGDEERVQEYFTSEIHPLFEHIEHNYPSAKSLIQNYHEKLDPVLGLIYTHRSDYEKSVQKINESIANVLERENRKAQHHLPHFFEKYKTDGVEYNIYAGDSLLKDRTLDEVDLSNLRLWQLETMCKITRTASRLKACLPVPMDTSQLILVHGAPLAIRFRQDEKHFDVDGTYNIRYEILKKRIDKANVAGTGERLTQPGKIAIVYSNQKDIQDYLRFIEYLQHRGLVVGEIEYHELERLQGVQGLRAIRISVDLESEQEVDILPIEEIDALLSLEEAAVKK
ncbi:MAG: GAF domain-containing protein, partial [Bacteroidota bacterium]